MKKIVLSVALFSVLAVFTGCDVVFNLNSNNNLSVNVDTQVDIDTNSLTADEPVVTEPVVTEPVVTEPVDESTKGIFCTGVFSKTSSSTEKIFSICWLICLMVLTYKPVGDSHEDYFIRAFGLLFLAFVLVVGYVIM